MEAIVQYFPIGTVYYAMQAGVDSKFRLWVRAQSVTI